MNFTMLFISLVLFFSLSIQLHAQTTVENIMYNRLETLAEQMETEELDIDEFTDFYLNKTLQPIAINNQPIQQLSEFNILSDFQLFSLQQYLEKYGSMVSLNELYHIAGFDSSTVQLISPFISLDGEPNTSLPSVKRVLNYGKQRVLFRSKKVLEQQAGYRSGNEPDKKYLGSPYYLSAQYKFKFSSKVQAALTAEKDAGEAFFSGNNRLGFDYYGFNVQVSEMKRLKRLVIGDYRANFGQGLSLWTSFGFGKTSDVMAISRQQNGFIASSSTDENNSFRGLATTLTHQSWAVSPFVSYRYVDAMVDNADNDSIATSYSSLNANGYHHTSKEIDKKRTLSQMVSGINVAYLRPYFTLGLTALHYRYGAENQLETKPYNQFRLHEASNSNLSIDAKYLWQNVNVFGEIGVSKNGGKAILLGSTIAMNRFVQLALLYRNYQRNYQADFAKAFAQNSRTENEQGYYVGVKTTLSHRCMVSAYVDTYSFPWLRYRVDSPSKGWDYLVQADYQCLQDLTLSFRLQQNQQSQNISKNVSSEQVMQDIKLSKMRIQADYSLSDELKMQTRLAYNWYQPSVTTPEKGMLLYQDIKYAFRNFPLSLSCRYAVFDTDGWNARFYAYESDILYAFSIPAYAGQGARYYLNVSYKINSSIQLWARIAQTRYTNVYNIGTGLSQIEGKHQTEAKVQLLFKF